MGKGSGSGGILRGDLFLLRTFSLRALWGHPLRTALTLLGIALGVSSYLAIRMANESALDGFRQTLDALAGRARLQVTAGGESFEEDVFASVRSAEGVRLATPLVQVLAVSHLPRRKGLGGTPGPGDPGGIPLLVLGIDTLSEPAFRDYELAEGGEGVSLEDLLSPDTLFITDRFAEAHGLHVGSPLFLSAGGPPRRLLVRGLVRSLGGRPARERAFVLDGGLALMDIAAAQEAFDRIGRLDRIDVLPREGVSLEDLVERLRRLLPGHLEIGRPAARQAQTERLMAAFQLNLTILSYVALLVGLFVVYNTMTISVLRRRREWGILRSLGVSRWRMIRVVLAEAGVLGLLGSALGLPLGLLLSRGALLAVGHSMRTLYAPLGGLWSVAPNGLFFPPGLLAGAVFLGTFTSLLSALVPAYEAAWATPREVFGRGGADLGKGSRYWPLWAGGATLLMGAYLLSRPGPVRGLPLFGYLSALALILGMSFLTPLFARGVSFALAPLRSRVRRPEAFLLDLTRSLGRNSVAVSALMTALAMLVSITIMVESFRGTVEAWIHQTIRADLFAAPAVRFIGGEGATMPPSLAERAAAVEGVQEVDAFRGRHIDLKGWRVFLGAGDLRVVRDFGRLSFLQGDPGEILTQAIEGGEVLVSEPLGYRLKLSRGSLLSLPTPRGPGAFRVAGVFYDYSTDGGLVVMDRSLYREIWSDDRVSTLAIYLTPGADPISVRARLAEIFPPESGIALFENARLRRQVLKVFDETFSATHALKWVALLVAVLGVLNTLMANVLERTREIGLLRALGFGRGDVFRGVVGEAGLLGLLSDLLGALTGGALALILIYVIQKQSFGWSIKLLWPSPEVAAYGLLVLLTALVSGLWPARAASRMDVVEALRFE